MKSADHFLSPYVHDQHFDQSSPITQNLACTSNLLSWSIALKIPTILQLYASQYKTETSARQMDNSPKINKLKVCQHISPHPTINIKNLKLNHTHSPRADNFLVLMILAANSNPVVF